MINFKNEIESKMSNKRVHIIKREDGWAVKKQGSRRASKVYRSKEAAKQGADPLRRKGHDVIIHKGDGSIEEWKKAKTA